jgi:predicted RNA-binding Zn-ribbon protein involved in translation (DUF1610 family)
MTPRKKYWYVTTHFECPPCGREDVYRERVYEKPKEAHKFETHYDYCLEGDGG